MSAANTSFFLRALDRPVHVIASYISRQLADLYPEHAVLYTTDGEFQLGSFVNAGNASCEPRPERFQLLDASYDGVEHRTTFSLVHSWVRVSYNEQELDVVSAAWQDGYCSQSHHWIVGTDEETVLQFFEAVCAWSSELRGEILVFQEGYWSKSKSLHEAIRSTTFDSLVLHSELKTEIQADLERFLCSRELYEKHAIPWKRGVLLTGPAGNGKSHAIKALVNALGIPCLYVTSFRSEHRNDHATIHSAFARARQVTPSLLVLEDLDSLVHDLNRSYFLNELDGFAANTGVIVMATTNHPERLDPAILERPSRFDRKYLFDLPDTELRAEYLQLWSDRLDPALRLHPRDTRAIAATTEGFSFAYLKELCLSAMMRWINVPGAAMGQVMQEQVALLRDQMSSMNETVPGGQLYEAGDEEGVEG